MISRLRLATLGLAPLALSLLFAPRPAQACDPDPCYWSDKWQSFELVSAVVATDGVLVIDARRGPNASNLTDQEALAHVEAQVSADGQPIAGGLELSEGWRGLVWRPAEPLPADALLSLTLTVDNDSIIDDGCEPWELDLGPFEAQVGAGPMPALGELTPTATAELDLRPTIQLHTLICCDSAYPHDQSMCFEDIGWSSGHCEANEGEGWLATTWSPGLAELPPELAGNLAWRVVSDAGERPAWPGQAELGLDHQEPLCGHVEVLNQASGEVVALPEQCFGEELVGQLGTQALDPAPGLEANCDGEPYTCEIIDLGWDMTDCEPYSPGGADTGDGDGDSGDGDSGDGDGDSGDGDSGDGDGDSGDGDSGDGTSGETGEDAGADGELGDRGCACTSSDTEPKPLLAALGLLVLGLVRRRRA